MIGTSVQQGLRQDGFCVDWVQDGAAAELALANEVYELVLLDLALREKTVAISSRVCASKAALFRC